MKIDKNKLTKALKQIGIFVGKNPVNKTVSYVHFRNEHNKAMIFATDFISAGRAHFDTDEDGLFEFCIEYDQLLQSVRARGKELDATIYTGKQNESGESMSGIEFTDGKSKFNWALHENDALKAQEDASVVPSEVPFFKIDAKTLKNALREAGFARNEKETQTPYIAGVNFDGCGDDFSMVSTNRHRIAAWRSQNPEAIKGMECNSVSGIMSPKTISSIGLYDDDEEVSIYITDSQIVLVSSNLEAYASKILCNYPNVQQMFDKEVVSSYRLSAKDLKESIEIVLGKEDSITLDFHADFVTVSTRSASGDGMTNDTFKCERISGNDESILIKSSDLLDVVKNVNDDDLCISFRPMGNGHNMLSYSVKDGAYGLIAPMTR